MSVSTMTLNSCSLTTALLLITTVESGEATNTLRTRSRKPLRCPATTVVSD